jgi:hypothetical protein
MTRKHLFITVLGLLTVSLVGCGDNNDKRLSDADVACVKLLQMGRSCGGVNGAPVGTATVTATSTVTITNTTVVNQ